VSDGSHKPTRGRAYERGRFDVVQRITSFDEKTGHAEVFIEPDPLRYEWQEHDGDRVLYDRFDQTIFPHEVVMDALRQAVSLPRPPPLAILADIDWYVEIRRPFIDAALDGYELVAERQDASEELLASLTHD
jgi:hypothetical protein